MQTERLALKKIKFNKKVTIEEVLSTAADSPIGFILEVESLCPEELHDKHCDYPLAPPKWRSYFNGWVALKKSFASRWKWKGQRTSKITRKDTQYFTEHCSCTASLAWKLTDCIEYNSSSKKNGWSPVSVWLVNSEQPAQTCSRKSWWITQLMEKRASRKGAEFRSKLCGHKEKRANESKIPFQELPNLHWKYCWYN